jgi:hypothetical protein
MSGLHIPLLDDELHNELNYDLLLLDSGLNCGEDAFCTPHGTLDDVQRRRLIPKQVVIFAL